MVELAVTHPDLVPTHLVRNIHHANHDECVELLQFIHSTPSGKKAIKKYSQTLSKGKRKMLFGIINAITTPFDAINSVLERGVNGFVNFLPG